MFDFNLDEVEAASSVVPKGTYMVQVEKSELETTKKGGQMIKIQFNIISEVQNGRKLFEAYNIVNENPEATKIGLGHIKSLVLASGASLSKFTSPDQLIGLECLINVKVVEDPDYGDSNKITNYKKIPTAAIMPTGNDGAATQPIAGELPKGEDGKPIF